MTDSNKGTLGFILVIIALFIAAANPIMGIVFLFLIFIFAIIDHYKNDNKSDNDNYPYV